MKKSKSTILLLAMVMILGISAASAADIDDTSDSDVLSVEETTVDEVVSTDAVDEVQTASEDTEVLTDDGDASNFTALQYRIDSSNTICYIMNDYKKAGGDDVVTISKDISIIARGGNFKIDANNNGGIFKINPGVSVYLSGITLVNGNSDYGAAIYNEGDLVLDGCTFSNNVATQNGGAIYNAATLDINDCILSDNIATYRGGAIYNEGTLTVTGSTIDSNDITFRAKNDDNGGAAIYNNGGTIDLYDVEVTNNLKDIVIRDGNDGHLINAAIFTNGDATIANSYIANNTGSWGAGVYVTNGATLTVSNTIFEGNNATFGAGIYDEGAVLNVDNCTFNDNLAIGVGSAGTSSTQAGAILVMAQGASATITNSRFNRNSAKTGGAVSISQATGSVLIDDCEFTENTASYEGGAIYNYIANGAALTVTDSTFTDNTATNWGNAISNDGDLSLSGNTISGEGAEIGNWLGEIDTQYQIRILDGQSHEVTVPTYQLTAIVTDDNGNKINDHNFIFLVGDEEVQGTYYTSEGMYIADYTFTAPGTYVITTDYENAEIINSSVTFIAALSSLKNIVDTAIANGETSVDLSYGFQYYEPIDGVDYHGIVISEDFTINGNGLAIDGGNAARLFNVANGATLTLNNITLTNGKADNGAAVYVDNGAKLDANDVTFSSNIALDNGGAIYTDGGEITLTNCVLDANDVTNLETSAAQNMGGAAIHAKNSQVTLVNTNVTNNGRSELDRSNGDLINAVINLINSDATITGGLFENNTGIYGGAIYAEGDGTQTLTVTGATFNNNKAYNGGAIDVDHGMITSISDSAFNNNLVVGPGSSGYYGAGGAISVGGTGSFSLTDSNFTANKATGDGATGGAVHVGLAVKDAASISGCEFTDNSATDRGSAIFNHGYVSLSDNVIDDELGIYSNGEIDSQVFVIFMDNEAKTFDAYDDVNAYAKVVDDNGNIIKVDSITLVTTGFAQGFGGTLFAFNETDNLYHAKLVPTKTGIGASVSNPLKKQFATVTVLSQIMTVTPTDRILEVTYENITEGDSLTVSVKLTRAKDGALISYATVTITIDNVTKSVSTRNGVGSVTFDNLTWGYYVINASVKGSSSYNPNEELNNLTVSPVKGTFTDLQYLIDNNDNDVLVLPYDFAYDDEYDADLIDGIVIDKDIAIDGDGYTINGNNAARIFKVTGGNTLALTDASLVNGYAEYGGAIYVDASNLVLDNCTLDSNDVFDLTDSNPNELGGAAIHAVDSTVTIADSYITNNGDRTLDRSDNKVINGAVNLINSNTEITGTLFENNTGIYGGAVFAKGGSLDVSDSEFISNIAYVGAGIRTEGTTLTVTGSKFEENEGRGTGSEGTSKNSGAAICSNGVASISITSSNFTRNSAENGGAINTNVISSSNTVEIDKCIFTDNVATEKGGAILVNNDAAETIISNSNFTGNDGVFGSAIFNLKTLSLSKNNIDEAGAITSASVIASKVIITVLDNENATYNVYDKIADFYAQVTDDNGNVIVTSDKILKIGFGTSVLNLEYDETDGLYHKSNVKVVKSGAPTLRPETKNLFTDITFEPPYITAIKLNATLEVEYENVTDQDDVVIGITLTGKEGETAISTTTSSIFTITVNNVPYSVKITKGIGSLTISDLPAGDYVINASWTGNTYYNPIEQLFNLTVSPKKGTFTDLQYIIDNDEIGLVVLPYDFKYDSDYDADLVNGVVIDKNLYVLGNDYTIDANNSARIFNVTNGAIFKIDDATLTNGRADYGGAIYVDVDSFLNTQNVVLYNNTATYRGGAIYSEGTVDVMDSVLDSNDITFRTKNDDNGGAAIYNLKGDLSISNSNITNNLKDIVIRNGNAGDLLVGVVVTSGYTFIEDSYFANNTGSWGGAISSLGYMNDESYLLSIKNSKFEGNNATFGGAIFVESSKLEVDNCTFENNKGLGVGSSGTSNTQGGAIIVHPAQSSVSITDSTFTGNSANVGAAVSLSRVDGDSIIENCTFTDNTASSEGGAIYGYTVGKLTVANSTFSGNTAPWGNAISNDGILVLSNNTVSGSSADIANYYGTIESEMNIVILNNETVTFTGETLIIAKVTDDNNNLIKDINFVFVVNETELEAKFNSTSGLYQAVYENDNAGFFVVNITYNEEENLVIKTGTLKNIKGTFTDLQNKVNAADNELSLSYNFTFVEGIDDALINGIVIDKAITIDGNGYTINGNDTARILQLNANGITIDNVTFTNGYADMDSTSSADWGGAIYSNGAYTNHIISNSRFYNNTAYNGGAIYLAGDDSKIINSTFEDNTANASGGAVFLFGWDCTIEGSNFTDNTANQLGGAVAMYSSHPAIIRESTFTKNIAGQNGGAVSWQRAAGSIFESTFTENEAGANGGAVFWDANPGSVAGGEFTGNIANGFGGAIFVNDNAGLTVASTFTENAALNGGAIAAFADTTVYTSTFTENTADNYGGAIFVNDGAELDIKQSTIKDNIATVGNSIYVMDGTVDSTIINATILDNKTWDDTDLGDIYILNATLTDDNGNMIYDPSFRFTVDGTVIEDVPLYDDETGLYTIPYYIGTAGPKVVSTNYDAENLEIFTGILDVPKANITEFGVLTIDALEGENATIWITLIGVNDQGLNSTVTVIVNNKEYAVPVENGEGNLTIEGLTHGQYPVVAMFDDPNYNPAINSSVFFVKGKSVLNITELTVAEYGDVIEIAINLTGSDGKPLTGVVVVDDVINVLVENGIGTFVIDNQPDVGNYTFQAVYDGDNDYFGDLAVFNVTVNTKVIDPEDIVVDIPNINEFGEAIPITITSPVDGTYTVNINGTPVEVEVVNGVGNATITLDKPGIYNATVDIADEGYSLETITTDEFEYLVTPEFNVEITGTYPEAEISIIGPAGTYHITIDGMEPVDITREESGLPSLVTITDMDAGNYTAFVSFDARDEYYGDYKEINFTVNKAALDIEEPEVIGDKVIESPINITFTLPADVDPSSVSAFMDGTPVPIDEFVVNETTGVYTLPLDGFSDAVGHLFSVEVNDPNYEEDGAQVTFTIEKVETTVTIKVNESEIGVMGGSTVNVTVSNNAAGYLVIDNNGVISVVEITNGTYSFEIYDLQAGEYYINATFLGNDKYLKSNATKVLNIPKSAATPEITDVTTEVTLGEDAIVLVDMNNDFASGNITVFVDGVENQTVDLDDYGLALVTIPGLTIGNHTIGVKYNGNDNYNASDIVTHTINVAKAGSKVTIDPIDNVAYGEDVYITYTVENKTNVKITVYDNTGEITPVMNITDGIIAIKGLTPGDYQIMIENEESNEYKSNFTMGYFTVGKADSTVTIDPIDNVAYGEEVYILYTVENKTNVKIIVYHADEIIDPEMVTEDGLITIKGLTPGNYEIYIENNESAEYKESFAMAEFTVGKAASSVTIVEIDDLVYPGNGEVLYEIKNKTEEQSIIVTFNGNVITVPYDEDSIELTDLAAGEYTITIKNLENDLYNGSEAAISFKVVKANPTFTSDVTENAKVGENVTITVQAPADATGNVTVTVDGELVGEVTLINGATTVNVTGLAAGHHSYEVTYEGDDNYEIASDLNSFDVVKVAPEIIISDPENPVVGNLVHATVTVADGNATGYIIFNNVAYKLKDGKATIDVGISEAGMQTITVEYLGDDKYSNATAVKAFTAAKATTEITLRDETLNTVVGREVEIVYTINPMVSKGNVSLWIDDVLYSNEEISIFTGSIVISGDKFPTNGTYTVKVQYIGTDDYANSNVDKLVINVEDETVVINITVPENTTVPVFNITVPSDATGLLLVDIDGKHYYAPVENGTASITVPGLEPGNYTANVTYTGDEFYDPATKTVEFTVPANADENSITIPEGATTTNPTFSIDLPSDATGYFEVDVDGKKYVVPVENGTAKISVPGLAPGNHNVTVKYSGDSKYNSISKSTTLKLKEPVPKLSENKYIKVVYSGKATYKVRLTLDGKAAAGKYVTINYNGKNYNVKTDSKGYATLKLNTKVKPKKYTVTATYKGVKVTSKVKVKHVIKAKNKKAKKSKKLNLYVKLKKVDGKVLKNKKVKLKFKGKKYTAKTNKKGKAKFTIKKKVMQKLKKGKKYKYKVYYGKDKVTKKIKVKK